jgi:hypothetical protein
MHALGTSGGRWVRSRARGVRTPLASPPPVRRAHALHCRHKTTVGGTHTIPIVEILLVQSTPQTVRVQRTTDGRYGRIRAQLNAWSVWRLPGVPGPCCLRWQDRSCHPVRSPENGTKGNFCSVESLILYIFLKSWNNCLNLRTKFEDPVCVRDSTMLPQTVIPSFCTRRPGDYDSVSGYRRTRLQCSDDDDVPERSAP